MEEERLWTRTFVALMVINFCSAMSFYLITVKITEYALVQLGAPYNIAGLSVSAYVVSALVTRLVFGRQIDRLGAKRALAIGAVVNVAAMLLYLAPLDFAQLVGVRIIHGFGFAVLSGSAAAGATLVIPANRSGEGIGYFSMMQALATGVGPFAAIAVVNAFGTYQAMFAAGAIAAFLALLVLFALDLPAVPQAGSRIAVEACDRAGGGHVPNEAVDAPASVSASTAADVRQRESTAADDRIQRRGSASGIGSLVQLAIVPLASVMLLLYFGYAGVLSFATVYATELGLDEAFGFFFVVYALVIMVSRPFVGRRIDRKGENSTIYACLTSFVAGFVLLGLTANAAMLLASAALIGFGIGATQSIIHAVIARDTAPDEQGRATSTFYMSMDLGSGVGPLVIGCIIPAIGYRASYFLIAVVGIFAAIDYYLVHGRHVRSQCKR